MTNKKVYYRIDNKVIMMKNTEWEEECWEKGEYEHPNLLQATVCCPSDKEWNRIVKVTEEIIE